MHWYQTPTPNLKRLKFTAPDGVLEGAHGQSTLLCRFL